MGNKMEKEEKTTNSTLPTLLLLDRRMISMSESSSTPILRGSSVSKQLPQPTPTLTRLPRVPPTVRRALHSSSRARPRAVRVPCEGGSLSGKDLLGDDLLHLFGLGGGGGFFFGGALEEGVVDDCGREREEGGGQYADEVIDDGNEGAL